jgi:rhomboid protease GluP
MPGPTEGRHVDASTRELAGPLPHRLAEEVALLLVAEGITATLAGTGAGTVVLVARDDLARAARIVVEEYPAGLVAEATRQRAPGRAAAPPAGWFGRASWVLLALVVACTAMYLAEERAGGSESRAVLLRFGATRPAHVRAGQYWRLVTALFVHIGPRHLLANLATLLVLGPALAQALGAGRFLFVYVLAGAAGNLLSYRVTPPDIVGAGASGAILGVLGALGGQRLRFAASARYRGWQVVAAILAYLAIAVGADPEVDTAAHLGGLVAGLVLGLLIPPAPAAPSPRERALALAYGAVAVAIVGAAFAGLVWSTRPG